MHIVSWFIVSAWSMHRVLAVEVNRTAEGYPVGFLSDCNGSDKPALIPKRLLNELTFVVDARKKNGQIYRKTFNYFTAPKGIPNDPYIDLKNRPTVIYVSGFVDTTAGLFARVIAGVYNRLNYNVILLDTNRFTTYIYTVASRVTRGVGRSTAEVLANMTKYGLDPKRTELVGLSLGGQVVSYIAKQYRQLTGLNFTRITALDPAGPCFRHLPANDRIDITDADEVLVIHTNIDAYGIATPVGHLDFYVNGGEYQPGDIPLVPCLILCSHLRSYFLWIVALEHPYSFIAMKCDTVQEARDGGCYGKKEQVTNFMGPKANFSRPGIFYVTTNNEYPYYMEQNGLKREYEVWSSHSIIDNKGDVPW